MAAESIRPTTLKIDPATKARMQRLADVRQRSSHWLMLEAIRQFVDREEKREAFRQDGIQAWHDYQATGLHLTMEEADVWLSSLESGTDEAPPQCHV